MQSVYKLPIAMAVLYADTMDRLSLDEKVAITPEDFVRRGVRSPLRDQFPQGGEFTIRELIGMSMTESDGTASDVLMEQAGGPTEVQSYLTQLGIRDMKVANSEKEIFRDWDTQYKSSATPLATIELLRALHEGGGISPEDRKVLLYFMENSDPGGRRLKKLLPEATPIAHKTGTGGNRDGVNSATNDIGIVELPDGRHLAIAVYISDSSADMATREKAIADIAKAAWDRWAK
jgi:beta-lactamase class A